MAEVDIRIIADSFDELKAAIARLRAGGVEITWEEQPAEGAERTPHAYGKLHLYDTPETVEQKARATGTFVRNVVRALDRMEYP